MSLWKFKIERGKIRKFFPKVRAGTHKYYKKCMNRFLRHQAKDVSEESLNPKRMFKGWEY